MCCGCENHVTSAPFPSLILPKDVRGSTKVLIVKVWISTGMVVTVALLYNLARRGLNQDYPLGLEWHAFYVLQCHFEKGGQMWPRQDSVAALLQNGFWSQTYHQIQTLTSYLTFLSPLICTKGGARNNSSCNIELLWKSNEIIEGKALSLA